MASFSGFLRASALAAACLSGAGAASAHEYPLQFTPLGNYEGLVVAGYQIVGKTVVGNCSYTRITAGSGRGGHIGYVPVPQTCTWDIYGDLIDIVAGEPAVPSPIKISGTETIYARKGSTLYTGSDSALSEGGFVFNADAFYAWQTPSPYQVLNTDAPYTFTVTLISDGDIPLKAVAVHATATAGTLTVDGASCKGMIPIGATCDVTVTLDPSQLTSPSGLAYSTVSLYLSSNAGVNPVWAQSYTIVVPIPPDDN